MPKRRRSQSPGPAKAKKKRVLTSESNSPEPTNVVVEQKDASEDEADFRGQGVRGINPTPDGEIKIVCYNLNGCRAAVKHGLPDYIERENADIYCFSEMKATEEQFEAPDGYQVIFNECTDKKGYAGSCVLTRIDPVDIVMGIGSSDGEGRAIVVEYEKFYLINTYVPNSGQNLKFKERRLEWDGFMKAKLVECKHQKPLIWTGDLNVAVEDWDVYDGETNKKRCKTAGFTPYERKNFREMVEGLKLVDAYRYFYPDSRKEGYTFWSNRASRKGQPTAKEKNAGWRLDYFVLSRDIVPLVSDIQIRKSTNCSDHCPLVLTLMNPNDSF